MSEHRESGSPKVTVNDAGQLVSAAPLCADKDGKLVPCDSAEANTQVVGAGVPIPPALVKLYRLQAKAEEPKRREPEPEPEPRPIVKSQK